jgi:ATP-binding cassette subfamily F protein uup
VGILLGVNALKATFGVRPLFDNVSFTIAEGDRIGLIGPNGAGKSTLLRILAGELGPDGGEVSRRRGLRIGRLAQVPRFTEGATVLDTLREGARAGSGGETGGSPGSPGASAAGGGGGHGDEEWEVEARIETLLAKLELSGRGAGSVGPDTRIAELSGGWKKRAALARELARAPELLLLDEPTNHLDSESIEWLEKFLASARMATLTITHDRVFLQRTTNRILELDRRNPDGLLAVDGNYQAYVRVKSETMHAQERREIVLRNSLRRESEWLSRGPAARSTKQQARIARAGELASTVAELGTRNEQRTASLDFQTAERRPRKLVEALQISKRYGARTVFEGVDVRLTPGTRIGLLGPNGCGKSTLIRVLLGHEPPTTGTVKRADGLEVAYFEQSRDTLDPDSTPSHTLCPDGDFVLFRGARIHVRGYLERFLFSHEQADMPVGKLSGGEQSRLLLAQLMLQPAQLLVLDEPTNDLDLATLGVLEETLNEFEGAVLLVSHDRYFLDQVATTLLAFDTDTAEAVVQPTTTAEAPPRPGRVVPFANLSQWEAWRAERQKAQKSAARRDGGAPAASGEAVPAGGAAPAARRKRLAFKEQRELEGMEATIAGAESALQAASAESLDPRHASDAPRLLELLAAVERKQAEVDRMYARWAELEEKQRG